MFSDRRFLVGNGIKFSKAAKICKQSLTHENLFDIIMISKRKRTAEIMIEVDCTRDKGDTGRLKGGYYAGKSVI